MEIRMLMEIDELRDELKSSLNKRRYEHTLSVSYLCIALAMRYGFDLDRAELAGLLHDCAKRYRDDELVDRCNKLGLKLTAEEKGAPKVVHAPLGAYMAEHKYGVTDLEILDAIRYHTTGRANMTLLDKIVYVADYIEPRRKEAPNLEHLRQLAFLDLDQAMLEMMEGTLNYLRETRSPINSVTEAAYEYYRNLRKEIVNGESV